MTNNITGKRLLSIISLSLLFIIIIGYGIWKGRDLIFGIRLTIYGIQNNETFKKSVIELSGIAEHAVSITINNRIISIEENGEWHDTIALLNGYNVISISAKDRFNRTTKKIFDVNYDAPPKTEPEIVPQSDTEITPSTTTSSTNQQTPVQ